MYCSVHLRVLILALTPVVSAYSISAQITIQPAGPTSLAQASSQANSSNTTVRLHWGARPGVSRYRLQLARDPAFSDIVFDRVVAGNEHQINDLPPRRYFWRIAPLTTKL